MAAQLALKTSDFEARAISPLLEMGAYEALWLRDKASFKTIADLFRDNEGAVPSDFVPEDEAIDCAERALEAMRQASRHPWRTSAHRAAGPAL